MTRKWLGLIGFTLVFLLFLGGCGKDGTVAANGSISGFVVDAHTGKLLTGLQVKLNGTPVSVVNGGYQAVDLMPGSYTLVFQAAGYQAQTFSVVVLKDTALNVSLQPLSSATPPPSSPPVTPAPPPVTPPAPGRFSAAEIDLLARLVHSEAEGEPYQGKVAVAATVLNRIASPQYPSTMNGVIYQVVDGKYVQYEPVLNGRINMPAGEESKRAVQDALKGVDPSRSATGFYNPAKTNNAWVRSRPVTAVIGNHIFFK